MKLFNRYAKPGKGVTKEEAQNRFGFRHFFAILSDKIWQIISLNLLFFLINLPLFGLFAYFSRVGGVSFQAPANALFSPLYGVMQHGDSPLSSTLYGVVGTQVESYYPSKITYVFLWIGLLTLLTFGLAMAAMTYLQRNFVKGQPSDLVSDFFSCIGKNWKQAILLGLVDLFLIFVIAFDMVSYYYSNQSFGFLILFYLTIFLSALYFLMRPYLYIMIVTFQIRIPKAIKNSYILALAGIKRNLFCTLFSVLVLVLNYLIYCFLPSLGVVLLFLITVSFSWFFQVYAAWPVVKKHMIDPFYKEEVVESGEEAIFRDQG